MSDVIEEQAVLTKWHDRVLLVTLNRPTRSNAFNPALLRGLAAAWSEAAEDRCRAVVVTGSGKNFCAGADLDATVKEPESMGLRSHMHPQYLQLDALEKPVIAAVNGAAAGGGLGMALAADIRICADTARFVPAFVQIGLVPDMGASYHAPRLLGASRAFDWFTSGRPMPAQEAYDLGIVSEIVPLDQLVSRALERARLLAEQPGNSVALTKALFALSRNNGLVDQLETEARFQARAFAAPGLTEQVAARMASFAKK